MPHQVSNAIRIIHGWTILGLRKLPMKRFSDSRLTRNTETMVRTIRFSLLRRTITPLRTSWATRLRTSNTLFTLEAFPLWRSSSRKSGLLAKNFCERFAHVSRSNAFRINTASSISYPFGFMRVLPSRSHIFLAEGNKNLSRVQQQTLNEVRLYKDQGITISQRPE
ncbi:hypothetical protein F2Q70_00016723 [Brassica cretica]|uniref:Uncharacterized protein n=1 Tax=Brassica cretica TaxID=69181 RepID=A0A8S9HZX0_BRACR|nr:hypothetical protein F2Q70_00016723 [Brassica cretica]